MHVLDLFFPRRCVSCGKVGSYFCQHCLSQIEFITHSICPVCTKPAIDGITHPRCQTPWGLNGMYAMAYYEGPIRKAIHLLKYRFVSDLVESLVSLLVNYYPKNLPQFDFLTFVPLHPKREKFRGFNQSALLTQILGKKLNIPTREKILKRIRFTKPQVELKGKVRRTNLHGAFACSKESNAAGKTIGLIDDVATTGSTLFECAKLLKRAGAKSVWGIVLAHG